MLAKKLNQRALTPRKAEIESRVQRALNRIADVYLPGCTEWYCEYPNNDWEAAREKLEQSLLYDSDTLVMHKIEWFETTMLSLCARYNRIKHQADQMGLDFGGIK